MLSLLDTMFIKRFCLPVNSNIQSFENGDEKISSFRCSSYNHSACIIKGKLNKLQVLSFGFNQIQNRHAGTASVFLLTNKLAGLIF